jgi:putative tricarboxylic transport membrane protein
MFLEGLHLVLGWDSLLGILIGTLIGVVIGIVPGLGSGAGMALILPLVFYLPPHVGLLVLLSLWQADGYGASISSILINVPGGSGAAFTCLDGYPLAKQGKAGLAMGLSMGSSVIGGFMGIAILMLFAPPIAKVAIMFSSADYFILAIFGILMVVLSMEGAYFKGFIMAGLGLMFSFIGVDVVTGYPRNVFGQIYLMDGIGFSVFIIGMYAIGRLVAELPHGGSVAEAAKLSGGLIGGMLEGIKIAFIRWKVSFRAGVIGILVGTLPGTGVSVSSALSYMDARTHTKDPTPFGTGNYDGVLAPECANNSTQGGGLIPTFTLGIPGTASCAIFLGGLIMYGIRPGPELFTQQGALVWAVFIGMAFGVLAFLVIGIIFISPFAKITLIPLNFLVPTTVMIAITGTYAMDGTMANVFLALAFGILGYLTGEFGYPIVPAIIGMILGPIAERNFYQAMLISNDSFSIFYKSWITVALVLVCIYMLASPFIKSYRARKRRDQKPDQQLPTQW